MGSKSLLGSILGGFWENLEGLGKGFWNFGVPFGQILGAFGQKRPCWDRSSCESWFGGMRGAIESAASGTDGRRMGLFCTPRCTRRILALLGALRIPLFYPKYPRRK